MEEEIEDKEYNLTNITYGKSHKYFQYIYINILKYSNFSKFRSK